MLVFAAFLVWPIVVDLFEDWWVRSTVYPYGAVFILVALLFAFQRRKDRPASRPEALGVGVLIVACCGLIAGRWAAEFVTSRVSVWLLVVSLMWTFAGFPVVRHFAGPLVLDLCSIPLPQILFNVLAAPVLKLIAGAMVAFCAMMGITLFADGSMLYTVNFQFALPDAASSIRNFPGLVVIAYLFSKLYAGDRVWNLRRYWFAWLFMVVVAALVSIGLVILRMVATVYFADMDRLNLAHWVYKYLSGVWASILGVLMVWLSQKLFWKVQWKGESI